MIIITLLVLAGAGIYFMHAEERERLLRASVALLRRVAQEGMRTWAEHRTSADSAQPWPVVTLVLAGGTFAAYVWTALAPGSLSDPDTLLAWGANFGPRTVNGEWWRLATASVLHGSLLALLINVAALAQVGVVLERTIGRPALAAVYLSAGVFAGLAAVSADPVAVTAGASGAICGLYGLLLTSWMWGLIYRSPDVRLPLIARLAPTAAVFVLYHSFAGELPLAARTAGLVTGFFGGLILAQGVHVRKPSLARIAMSVSVIALAALPSAVPLRGLTDVRPLLGHIISVETASAAAYETQVAKFRDGRTTAEALCSLIEREILPELQAADASLRALHGVPQAHEPLTAVAQRFLTKRAESWRLRILGLKKGSMPVLRDAERVERESLELFEKVVAGQPTRS